MNRSLYFLIIVFFLFQPFLLASCTILLISITLGAAQRFQRRHGLSDFATTDLLRHARASTLSDEVEYPSIESRQLPNRRKFLPRQRALRPVLKPRLNRNRVNSLVSSEQQNLNIVQEGLPQQTKNQNRVGVRNIFGDLVRRRQHDSNVPYTKRFGPNDGFEWPKDFGSFSNDHNTKAI